MNGAVKALVWFGLGAGIGIFAGYSIGRKKGLQEYYDHEAEELGSFDEEAASEEELHRKVTETMNEYLGQPATDEEPEMPMDIPEMPKDPLEGDTDGDEVYIPQFHPATMQIQVITEDEFNRNEHDLEIKNLIWYEQNEVLYDEEEDRDLIPPDDYVGYGTLMGFGGDPNNPVETLYVEDFTRGTMYRIDRVDAASTDVVGKALREINLEDEDEGV